MTLSVPVWVILAIIPFVVFVFFLSRKSGVRGYMGSDRDWHTMFFFFPTATASLLIALLYFVGKSYGWWE